MRLFIDIINWVIAICATWVIIAFPIRAYKAFRKGYDGSDGK